MRDILEKLTFEMNRVNPEGFARFNQGILAQEIDKVLMGFPISSKEFIEVLELLQWRNGGLACTGGGVDVVIMPGFMLLSLEEIVSFYDLTKITPRCGNDLIPFTNDCSSGYHYYDIRNKSIVYNMPEDPGITRYISMLDFLNAIYRCYKEDIFFLRKDGCLIADYERKENIFSSIISVPKRKGLFG